MVYHEKEFNVICEQKIHTARSRMRVFPFRMYNLYTPRNIKRKSEDSIHVSVKRKAIFEFTVRTLFKAPFHATHLILNV